MGPIEMLWFPFLEKSKALFLLKVRSQSVILPKYLNKWTTSCTGWSLSTTGPMLLAFSCIFRPH